MKPRHIVLGIWVACGVAALANAAMLAVHFASYIPVSAPALPARPAEVRDPYRPDCRIVRDYLKAQYGDVEILSWGSRTLFRSRLGDSVHLSARFRVRPGESVKDGSFTIGPSETVEHVMIRD